MDTKQQILMSLSLLVSEQLGVRQDAITYNAAWMQLGADSLDRLAISLAIEETFRVEIPHPVGERLNTVGDTLEHLWRLLSARRALCSEVVLSDASSAFAIVALMHERTTPQGAELNSKQQLLKHLGPMISDQLGVRSEWITQNATWLQLGADSLDRLAITLAIEDTFHVDIPHQVGERLNTVGDTLDHVWGLVSTTNLALGRADGFPQPGGTQA